MFILKYYFPSKSFTAVREAFSNLYPDKGDEIRQEYTEVANSQERLCTRTLSKFSGLSLLPCPSPNMTTIQKLRINRSLIQKIYAQLEL